MAHRLRAVDDATPIPRSQPPGCLPVVPKVIGDAAATASAAAATASAKATTIAAGAGRRPTAAVGGAKPDPTHPDPEAGERRTGGGGPAWRRYGRRMAWATFLIVVLSAFLGAARLPVHTYLDNNAALAETQQELDEVRSANERMQQELHRLDADSEIERVAREQYGWVKPGEEVYRIPQPAEDPVAVPDAWPFTQLHDRLHAIDPTAPQTAASTTTTNPDASATSTTAPGGSAAGASATSTVSSR